MTTLFKHQKDFLDKDVKKGTLAWSCGTGKTITAIEWGKKDDYLGVLVICPKALKTNWENEVAKHRSNSSGTWLIMTKEEFRRDAQKIPYFGSVIVDEVHIGFLTPLWKSQMSKALKNYLKKHSVGRVLLLSATPYTSSPWNIYNLAFLTGSKWNWKMFRMKFFDDIRMGMRIVPVAKKGCEKELAKLVKKIADVVDINDIMDVPLQWHTDPEYFSMNASQKLLLKKAYDPLPIVRYTKQHEIEQGFLLDGEGGYECAVSADKIDRIKALVEENPKIAIVCRYNVQIDQLSLILEEYKPLMIRGDVHNRHEICEKAEARDKAVILIQADCAEGYQLPSFPVCVFASQSYSYVKWEQMCGRFLRMDKPSRTTFIYLLTDGDSIDQGVYDAVKRKEDFKIELFNKAKK